MNKKNNNNIGTLLIPLITLIITIIALIPAFLSLNDKEAIIYYQMKFSKINIPKSINEDKALKLLKDNGIPDNTLELKIINQGNTSAKKVKISISLPNEPMAIWSKPSKKDNPIWIELPQFNKLKSTNSNLTLENMATTKSFSIFVGYTNIKNSNVNVQIFHDGIPAIKVNNILEVDKWSKWNIFKIPVYILLGGLILTIIWSFIVALYRNPEFRESALNILFDILHQGFTYSQVIEIVEKEVKKKKQTPNKSLEEEQVKSADN